MKNLILTIVFGLGSILLQAQGQRFAYVDTQYILKKIPGYKQAQQQLDNYSKQWQGEVEALLSEADALQKSLDAEKILLTDEMVKEREKVIKDKETEARNLQRKYFSPEGELFKKRQELVKPIQDQVFNAVQDVARKKRLDAVFDKGSGALLMLYASDKIDISDDVLQVLGY
jgi:outer membrane protein